MRRTQLKNDLAKVREALDRIQRLGEEAAEATGAATNGGPLANGSELGGSVIGVGAGVDIRGTSFCQEDINDDGSDV